MKHVVGLFKDKEVIPVEEKELMVGPPEPILTMVKEFVTIKQVVKEREFPYQVEFLTLGGAGKFGIQEIGDEAQEHFLIVSLNAKNKINAIHRLSHGTVTETSVSAREVCQAALLANACSIMIFHNHPSNDLEPSNADISITKEIERATEYLGIRLLDHLIVGHSEYYSFREHRILTT